MRVLFSLKWKIMNGRVEAYLLYSAWLHVLPPTPTTTASRTSKARALVMLAHWNMTRLVYLTGRLVCETDCWGSERFEPSSIKTVTVKDSIKLVLYIISTD